MHALYSDNTGVMTPKSAIRFILGATNEHVSETDNRIKGLFDGYDSDKDGKMLEEEFVRFYRDASREKADRVFDNVKNHFISGDLTWFREYYQETMFKPEEMPKKTLSANQECFDTLLSLLDRGDGTEDVVWGLIRSLETN
jgi:hypothetical protein